MPKAYKLLLMDDVEAALRNAARRQNMPFEHFVCEAVLSLVGKQEGAQLKPLVGRAVEAAQMESQKMG